MYILYLSWLSYKVLVFLELLTSSSLCSLLVYPHPRSRTLNWQILLFIHNYQTLFSCLEGFVGLDVEITKYFIIIVFQYSFWFVLISCFRLIKTICTIPSVRFLPCHDLYSFDVSFYIYWCVFFFSFKSLHNCIICYFSGVSFWCVILIHSFWAAMVREFVSIFRCPPRSHGHSFWTWYFLSVY